MIVTVGKDKEQLSIKLFVKRNGQWIHFKGEAAKNRISICKILYTNNDNLEKIIEDTKNSLSAKSNRGGEEDENIMKGLRESVVQLRDGTFYKLVVEEDGNIAETDEVVGKLKEGEVYDEGNNNDESGKAVPPPGAASTSGAASPSSTAEGSPPRASPLAAAATTDAAATSSTTEANQSAKDTSNTVASLFDTALELMCNERSLELMCNKKRKLTDSNEEGASLHERFDNYNNNVIQSAMLEVAKSCTQAQKKKCYSLLEEELEKKLKELDHYTKAMKDMDNRLVELEEEKDKIEKAMQNEKNEYLNNFFQDRENRSIVMKGNEDKIAEEWEAFEEKRNEAIVAHKRIVDELPLPAALMGEKIIVGNVTTPATLKKKFEKSKKYETWEASVELKYDRTRVTLSLDPEESDSSSESSSSSTTTTT